MSEPFAPSEIERRAFAERGWLITPPLFDGPHLEAVRVEIERAWVERTAALARSTLRGAASMADYARARPELQRLHLDSALLSAFCRSDALSRVARALIGPDTDLSWNQAYAKAPHADARTEIPWHQDDYYAEIDGERINCWVAITATTIANGTLHHAPQSASLLPHVWDEPLLFYRCDVDEASATPVELAPGQAFVFSGRVPHRSGVNRSAATRVAYSVSFASSSARLRANGEAFGDRVPILRGGRSADGSIRDLALGGADDLGLLAEIRKRAGLRASEIDAAMDACRAALGRGDDEGAARLVGEILAVLPDSAEVLGDLVRSRTRVDQLLREVDLARGTPAERPLLERILSLEPGHPAALARLAAHSGRDQRGTK